MSFMPSIRLLGVLLQTPGRPGHESITKADICEGPGGQWCMIYLSLMATKHCSRTDKARWVDIEIDRQIPMCYLMLNSRIRRIYNLM